MTHLNAVAGHQVAGYPVVYFKSTLDGKPRLMARLPDLPGCMADGPTQQDAIAALAEAFDAYASVAGEDGWELPAPYSSFARSEATTGTGGGMATLQFVTFQIVDVRGSVEVIAEPPVVVAV